jgi:hypothetical protein
MRTLGELAQAAYSAEPLPSPLPLYAGLTALPSGYTRTIPDSLIFQMWKTLQSFARALTQYAERNPEYAPNVNTWRTQAALVMNRAVTGAWSKTAIANNFDLLVSGAKEILGTPESWTAYVGPALQETASGLSQSIRSAVVTVAKEAAAAAEFAAEKAGTIVSKFTLSAILPILLIGGLGITGLYIWQRGKYAP